MTQDEPNYSFLSYIADYHCGEMEETAYGTIKVEAAVSVTGNFESGAVLLQQYQRMYKFLPSLYILYPLQGPSLAMPARASELIYNERVSPPDEIEAATLVLELSSGEKIMNTALSESSVPVYREQHIRNYEVQAVVKAPDFLAAFEKASSLSIDVTDATHNSLLHDVRSIDHVAISAILERLTARVREKMRNFKLECEAVRPE
jgi:hypothetical protein